MQGDDREHRRAVYEANMINMRDSLLHREKSLDRDLLPYGDPAGKDILVFGSGRGNEVLWAARHGAASVVAIDLVLQSPEPLRRAMEHAGVSYTNFEFRQENIHDTALRDENYDLIVSNGVFEHVLDLKGVLNRLSSPATAWRPDRHLRGWALVLIDRWPHWKGSLGAPALRSTRPSRRAQAPALGCLL